MGYLSSLLVVFVSILSVYDVYGLTGHTCTYTEMAAYLARTCDNWFCAGTHVVTRYQQVNKLHCCTGWREDEWNACSIATCSKPCKNGGTCVSPNRCSCARGYTGTDCSTPTCSPSCKNGGTCRAPNTCRCTNGYTGSDCSQPVCSPVCQNSGKCVAPNKCTCTGGYNGTNCDNPICTKPCQNGGSCVSPDTCSCPSGYTGSDCTSPTCNPSCKHGGTCLSPNLCGCPDGYNGSDCSHPICSPSCPTNGNCVAPNTCNCSDGYNGTQCENPICSPVCSNNKSCVAPNTCKCADGYNGTQCENPICLTACFNKGRCVAPEKCKCDKHWTGDHCTRPLCHPSCSTGGLCVNPNECRYPTNLNGTKACHEKQLDVSFVVDSSSSIGADNFQRMKQFIKAVIEELEISDTFTHISMIKFGLTPSVQFHMTDHLNKTEILQAVDGIAYSGGGTSTSDAIELMRTEGFKGERTDAPDVGIVITDGLSKYPHLTRKQADQAKRDGITMIAVGVGHEASHAELAGIASGLSRIFEVVNFKALLAIDDDVARTMCEVELSKGYTSRTTTTTISPVTHDGCVDTGNCTDYARDMCLDYEDWARVNCARTCGFCGKDENEHVVECKDTIDDCNHYDRHMCMDATYFVWVQNHCADFCGFCGNKTDEYHVDNVEVSTTQVSLVCKDSLQHCSDYGGTSVCIDPEFAGWTRDNCPKYCGKCYTLRHYDAIDVGTLSCPSWDLPEECSLVYKDGNCCPLPDCPPDLRLTVNRQ